MFFGLALAFCGILIVTCINLKDKRGVYLVFVLHSNFHGFPATVTVFVTQMGSPLV